MTLQLSFLRFLLPWHSGFRAGQLADEIAQQCRVALCQRVYRYAANAGVAEIRGYARAQAAGCVADQMDRLLSDRHLKPAIRKKVADVAIDQLIGIVVRDVLCGEHLANARTMAA